MVNTVGLPGAAPGTPHYKYGDMNCLSIGPQCSRKQLRGVAMVNQTPTKEKDWFLSLRIATLRSLGVSIALPHG